MMTKLWLAVFMAMVCGLAAAHGDEDVHSGRVLLVGVKDLKQPEHSVFSGGQPTQAQLKKLADLGIKHVINLRPKAEQPFDEKAVVEGLGMQYHTIPVSGAAGITAENAHRLDALLDDFYGQATLVHCASGNRVGALIALEKGMRNNGDVYGAIKRGQAWGLSSLKPVVQKKLTVFNAAQKK